jgi:eukaryotic-like serine/threonine-protein kinase
MTSGVMNHVLAGRYRLEHALGSGGMGSVYRATQLGLDRSVAVKLLTVPTADALGRFEREAKVLAQLEHPGIVKVFDFGIDGGEAFLVMELVEGWTLEKVITREAPPPLARFLALATGMLEALGASHAAGVVHRDVKPANVMLRGGPDGSPVLLDFGIARIERAEAQALTQEGMVLGTAAYMSPEQVRGEAVDGRADLYGAACVFYELLSGRPPFESVAVADVLAAQLYREATPLTQRQLVRPVSPAVDACILKALAKRPQDRFDTASDFAESLAAAVGTVRRGEAKRERPPASRPSDIVTSQVPRVVICGSGGTSTERELVQNALAVAGINIVSEAPDVCLLVLGLNDDVVATARTQLAAAPGVPVIVALHHVEPVVLAAAVAAGVYDVVLWPPEPTRLVRKVLQGSRRTQNARPGP